ncbi:unnamed protein product [Peniophora sp. CBMAI 1063]|nr:unnamed protein product [Peniophora sp. CBMAI 1063]
MPNLTLLAYRRLRAGGTLFVQRALHVAKRDRSTRAIEGPAVQPAPTALAMISPTVVAESPGSISVQPLRRRPKVSKKMTKDILLLSLEGLAQSADAFPPLKSVVGGLLFIMTQVDAVSSNKEQVREIYTQIDVFAASLVRAVPDVTMLSPITQDAIRVLAEDMQAVHQDMEGLARQRVLVRFIRAKRHSSELQNLLKRLDQADASFTRAMLASTDVQNTRILACVQPLRAECLAAGATDESRRVSR